MARRSVTSFQRHFASAFVACGIPLSLMGAYMFLFGSFPNYVNELNMRTTIDSRWTLHAIASVTALLPLAVSLWVSRKRTLGENDFLLLLSVIIYLLSLWIAGGSGWDRFYLTIHPVIAPLVVARLRFVPGMIIPRAAVTLTLAHVVAYALRIEIGVFY